ncbi:hypothetical protein AX769_17495 [Frondihabitans sp. PAMC 28766]|uniref:alpha-L-fucosidase n=1 Tax=Frondihabitans sp. PAMC 28766 TaxID=1795630 RepID=UPI00078EABED|nr:alpha-L-fucosidase [Frondihabitans sp. PAMC 28766]AMM21607.1 hypothetical protein AX769_17495 [Frondihabitans sp. PAMC 28766]
MTTGVHSRSAWLHPDLEAIAPRPRRKVHLDYHNSQFEPRVGYAFDPDEFVATLKKASIDSIVVFAKDMHGYFYYPSEHGPVHPGLEGLDLMGEQVEACRRAGIKVYTYYCVTWDNYLAEHHPEWLCFRRERDTYLPAFDETPNWTALCLSNDDYVELMLDHTREILSRCRPDGVWYDMPMPNPEVECFCHNCLEAIRAEGKDPFDIRVQRERMQELLTMWLRRSKEVVDEVAPGVELEQNNQTRLGLAERAEYLYNVDIEALPSGEWGYGYFPLNARYVRSLDLPSTGMTGRFLLTWADFGGLKSENQLTLETAWIAATGSAVCIGDQAPPSARLEPGVYRTIGAAYGSLAAIDDVLEGAVGVAEAALVVSGLQLADYGRTERHGTHAISDGASGAAKMLSELGVQYDVVEAGTVDLDRYPLVIVAEGDELTPAVTAELEAYVEAGGTLVHSAVPGTTLDEAPWLRDLGVTHSEPSPFTPAYLRIADGFGDTVDGYDFALYDGADRWTLGGDAPSDSVQVAATLGEPLFQRSPEHYTSHHQSPVATQTGKPVVLVGDRLAAFAFPVASGYYAHGYWLYAELFRRVLDSVHPERLVRSSAPSSLELGLTHQPETATHGERFILHAVNFAGATRRGRDHTEYFDQVVPQSGVPVELDLPLDVARVYDARTGLDVESTGEGGRIQVTLPAVAIHGVLVLEATRRSDLP